MASDYKIWLQKRVQKVCGIKPSGLSGLYCYFLLLSHHWMKQNGIAGWLIPSEFMDVNYGVALKRYLLNDVTLLQIHRFDPIDVQFDDALVSSSIVWFKKSLPSKNHNVKFTCGGTIDNPHYVKNIATEILATEPKWTRFPISSERVHANTPKLSTFFSTKRGIATGDNSYFIMSLDEIKSRNLPLLEFKPILPSPRYLHRKRSTIR